MPTLKSIKTFATSVEQGSSGNNIQSWSNPTNLKQENVGTSTNLSNIFASSIIKLKGFNLTIPKGAEIVSSNFIFKTVMERSNLMFKIAGEITKENKEINYSNVSLNNWTVGGDNCVISGTYNGIPAMFCHRGSDIQKQYDKSFDDYNNLSDYNVYLAVAKDTQASIQGGNFGIINAYHYLEYYESKFTIDVHRLDNNQYVNHHSEFEIEIENTDGITASQEIKMSVPTGIQILYNTKQYYYENNQWVLESNSPNVEIGRYLIWNTGSFGDRSSPSSIKQKRKLKVEVILKSVGMKQFYVEIQNEDKTNKTFGIRVLKNPSIKGGIFNKRTGNKFTRNNTLVKLFRKNDDETSWTLDASTTTNSNGEFSFGDKFLTEGIKRYYVVIDDIINYEELQSNIITYTVDGTIHVTNTNELKDALNIAQKGDIISIAQGEYSLDKRYPLPNCEIRGVGVDKTIIKNYGFEFNDVSQNNYNVNIHDITFDGQNNEVSNRDFIILNNESNANIHDCKFTNMGNSTWNSTNIRIMKTNQNKTINIYDNIFEGSNTVLSDGHSNASIGAYNLADAYNVNIYYNQFNHPYENCSVLYNNKAIAFFNDRASTSLHNCIAKCNNYIGEGDTNYGITESNCDIKINSVFSDLYFELTERNTTYCICEIHGYLKQSDGKPIKNRKILIYGKVLNLPQTVFSFNLTTDENGYFDFMSTNYDARLMNNSYVVCYFYFNGDFKYNNTSTSKTWFKS